jgi:Asp-tRNA(Asn)/Glu-tRNA(Gln) amidotransferase A subunit family amidase
MEPKKSADATMDLTTLSATQAAEAIRTGELSSEELTRAYLARAAEREDEVGAWTFLDPDMALAQATAADEARAARNVSGPLHGVPVGVKDIFDTWDMPTENGSRIHAGRRPQADATAVARLREAGAIILGKTVTTEFATFHPGKTRNPHDTTRTPGGSSSGSAAAVATGMAPLAIGSQTVGSVIRPAAFCGVVGYKPTFGLVPRTGSFRLSRVLDHVGVFARTVEDAALITEAMAGHDAADPDTRAEARPRLVATCREEPPAAPIFAFVRTPAWDQMEPQAAETFLAFVEHLGDRVEEVPLGDLFQDFYDRHLTVLCTDLAVNLSREYRHAPTQISPRLRSMIGRGRLTRATEYLDVLTLAEAYAETLDTIFRYCNAILTPAAPGPAPVGTATGSPIFCSIWTLCGFPAVTLPLLVSEEGLPMGVQVVGPRGDDARLLRTARWLAGIVANPPKRKTSKKK